MTDQTQLTDKQLDILHDHYKETFARLRDAEALRDRLFLWVVGLFAILSVEIGYPTAVGGILKKLPIVGGEVDLTSFPHAALLNATWVLLLTVGLRYCQTSVLVSRQYPYLHMLEEVISPAVGGGDRYQREGKVYLRDYPLLLDVAWFAYVILFPLILMFAALGLAYWELRRTSFLYQSVFDALLAGVFVVFVFLYRMQPAIAAKWRKWQTRTLVRNPPPQAIRTTVLAAEDEGQEAPAPDPGVEMGAG